MREKSTSNLESTLKKAKGVSYEQLLDSTSLTGPIPLRDYLNKYISDHDLICSQIKHDSLIPKDYVDGIFNGHRKNPSRDRVIAITRAMHMNYEETQRTLKIAQVGALYPKIPRDLAISYAIAHDYSVLELNDFLENKGFETLETQKK